jgi:glycosyltransferase involved in cell wall biosynthesis
MNARPKRKILHVVGRMNRGGVETWLMNVMRNLDREQFETHFLVHRAAEGEFDREILRLGGQIHRGASPRNLLQYATNFDRIVKSNRGFDVVHSHVYWFSGFVMRLSYEAGIPVRIAHSHTTASGPAWHLPRKIYEKLMRQWIRRYATHRVGMSRQAGIALFGEDENYAFQLLRHGMDFAPFDKVQPAAAAKSALGIAPQRKVIGQVGRFTRVKNHDFTVEVFAKTVADGTDAHLLLVGDGELLPSIRAQINSRGLAGRCTLTGIQPNVIPYFSAMDVFLMPSRWEGLGLVALEAQAAGVPVIASTGVPADVDVIPRLIEHLPLKEGATEWAQEVQRKLNEPVARHGDEPQILRDSPFGLDERLDALRSIYLGQTN